MSLTTKPRPGSAHKKLKAGHHKRSKNYLKTYWPYIPIAVIITLGFIINHLIHSQSHSTPVQLTNFTYYDVIESSIGAIALAIFLLRHAFAWHKVLVKGEDFVAHHPMFDIVLVIIATACLVLSNNGLIII